MRELVVTADDFGQAVEVNEAVEIAHRDGILSAASLMVAGPAAADAVSRAKRLSRLRIGLHLTLVEARPMLEAAAIPDLVDRSGRLRNDLGRLGLAITLSPKVRRELHAEIRAQFEAFRATGLVLDHVNAHQHYHLHPAVLGAILKIGLEFGMRALRVPSEPLATLRLVEPVAASAVTMMAAPWAKLMAMRVRGKGLVTTDQVFGLTWSGHMTEPRLAGLLTNLPPGRSEIYLHPATAGGYEGAAPGYLYAEELGALMSPRCRAAVSERHVLLCGYADLP